MIDDVFIQLNDGATNGEFYNNRFEPLNRKPVWRHLRILFRRWWQRPREVVLRGDFVIHHNWVDGEPPWLAIDFNEAQDGQVRVSNTRGAEVGDAVRLYDPDDGTEATGKVVADGVVAFTPLGDTDGT